MEGMQFGQVAVARGASELGLTAWPLATPKPSGGRTQIWAFASGKGGVGRSFLTANLGAVLAQHDWASTLVDLDFGGGDLHTLLGLASGGGGVSQFLEDEGVGLESLVETLEIPSLSLLRSSLANQQVPNARKRQKLRIAIERLQAPLALVDLVGGGSRVVLDFFVAADRSILIVLPEPTAVENAHRFIKSVYLRKLELEARARGVSRTTFACHIAAEARWRPAQLLERLEGQSAGLGQALEDVMASFSVCLLMNQVRHTSDLAVAHSMKTAVQSYFGIQVHFVGAVGYDGAAWLSARRRRLRVREPSAGILARELAEVAQNLLSGGEVEPTLSAVQGLEL